MPAPPLGLVARGTISEVIDGDTVHVVCLGMPMKVRLMDCWSPELHRGTEEERSAGWAAKRYMDSLAKAGDSCVVQIPTGEAKNLADVFSFGRVIGSVWVDAGGISLAQQMIEAGHAKAEK